MKSLLNFEQGWVFCLFCNILLRESIEVYAMLTHFFIPTLLSLIISLFYILLFHTSVIFLIVSMVISDLSLLLCK